jgi:hypothetical protein
MHSFGTGCNAGGALTLSPEGEKLIALIGFLFSLSAKAQDRQSKHMGGKI